VAGSYSGNIGFLKVYHPLEDEDGDLVGPGDWNINGAATFVTAGAKFGKALLTDSNGESLRVGVNIPAIDESDTAKTLWHCFYKADDLSFVRTMGFITDASFASERSRISYTISPSRLIARWVRGTDLAGANTNKIEVVSNSGIVALDTQHSIVGFVDGGSIGQGKIYLDGVDETLTVTATGQGSPGSTTKRVIIGNAQTGLAPARVVDELCMIQSPTLTDALVASHVPLYKDTRGFGYFPVFGSLDVTSGHGGDSVTLSGQGYGGDVVVKMGGVVVDAQVLVDEGTITFKVPILPPGVHTLSIQNVVANVTWTENAAFTLDPTPTGPNHFGTNPISDGSFLRTIGSGGTELIIGDTIYDLVSTEQIQSYDRQGVDFVGVDLVDISARMNYKLPNTGMGLFSHSLASGPDSYSGEYNISAGQWEVAQVISGVRTVLGTFSEVIPADEFHVIRFVVLDVATKKELVLYRDNELIIGPFTTQTSDVLSDVLQKAGFFWGGGGQIDWWTMNLVLAITKVTPSYFPPGEQPDLVIEGTGFASGTLFFVGGLPLLNQVIVSDKKVTGKTPLVGVGNHDVVAKFGTL